MKAMVETLESRTLLSDASVGPIGNVSPPNDAVVVVGPIYTIPSNDFPSPVGRFGYLSIVPNTPTHSQGTFVIQQWNIAAGTMQFKLIDQNGVIHRGVGKIISGDSFKFHYQIGNRITTVKASFTNLGHYAEARGTYITRNLQGVQKATGEWENSRYTPD